VTNFRARFLWVIALFGILVILGSAGYALIEGWGIMDAAYMTVITLTAVGFNEVQPLTQDGRIFTMILLGAGITWMGTWFALITSFIVELDLTHVLRARRNTKRLNAMENHVIVCGAGRTGQQVIQELQDMKASCVVIERDHGRVEELREDFPDVMVVTEDATHDEALIEAGLRRARGLVACLSADTDNLFICLSARDLEPELTIVARAYEEETMDKLYRAGATHVVSPNVSGAVRMASVLLRPSVVSFLDIATRSSDMALRMEQARIKAKSRLVGSTLAEAKIPQATGLIVIALKKEDAAPGGFVFNPVADTQLDAGDELIVLGAQEQIDELMAFLDH